MELSREEWVLAKTIVNAAICANAAFCAPEYSEESKKRILEAVKEETSKWQRESLAYFVDETQQN